MSIIRKIATIVKRKLVKRKFHREEESFYIYKYSYHLPIGRKSYMIHLSKDKKRVQIIENNKRKVEDMPTLILIFKALRRGK